MQTGQLDCFMTAARLLNFTKAAKVHYMSQQTFTNQIRNLEKDMGVRLFNHDANGWSLTEAGEVLLDRAPVVRAQLTKMVEDVQDAHDGYDSSLTIVSLDGLLLNIEYLIAMRQLSDNHPRLKIVGNRASYKGVRKSLENDLCDAAITLRFDMERFDGYESLTLMTSRPALAVSAIHPLASRESVDPSDFDGLDLYASDDIEGGSYEHLRNILPAGVQPNLHRMRNSSQAVLKVEMGFGATIHISDTILAGNRNVVLVPIAGMDEREITLFWRASNANPYLGEFIALLREGMDSKNN